MEIQKHVTQRDSGEIAGTGSTTHSSALGTDTRSPPFSKAEAWLLQLKGSRATVLLLQGRSLQPP